MPNGGGSARQQLIYDLRITADTEGIRLASQGFQQVSKQADRAANEMARAFGPKLTQGWQQVRMRTVEMGKSLVGVGHAVEKVDPQFKRMGRELRTMGEAQEKAGLSGDLHSKMLDKQAASLGRMGRTIEKTITTQQGALMVKQQDLAVMERSKPTSDDDIATREKGIVSLKKETAELENNIRQRQLYAATLKQGSREQAVFSGQTSKAKETMGSFTGEATMAQKAGQGMILSFSGAQAAAGNYQQALFGLGFSMMFVGKSMLGWPLIIGAAATAMTVGIPKLIAWAKGAEEEVVPAGEHVTEMMEELRLAIDEAKGPTKLFAEELKTLFEQEPETFQTMITQMEELGAVSDETQKVLDVTGLSMQQLASITTGGAESTEKYGLLSRQMSKDIVGLGLNINELGQELVDNGLWWSEVAKASLEAGTALGDVTKNVEEYRGAIHEMLAANQLAIDQAKAEAAANREREAALEGIKSGYDTLREGLKQIYDTWADDVREGAEAATEAVNEGLDAQTEAVQDGMQDQTTAMREAAKERQDIIKDALKDELDVIREAAQERQDVIKDALNDELDAIREQAQDRQDAIKDALDTETEAIKDAADDRIDIIRDQLKDELDAIKDAADARVDAIKDAASDEIDIHKERISELRDMERSLAKELSDLTSRRQDIIGAAMTAQAEIAALEAAQAQAGGDDPRLAAMIALREARLAALAALDADAQAAQAAAQEQLDAIEGQIEGEEAAIDAAEDRRDREIDAVEDVRDAAIEAAKDAADARIEAEEDARDAAIEAAKEAAKEKVKADKKATDAAIEGAQDAAKEKIKADKKVTDTAIENAQDIANEKIKEDTKATNNAITEAQREARERIKEAQGVATEAIKSINDTRDADVEALGIRHEEHQKVLDKMEDIAIERETQTTEEEEINELIRERNRLTAQSLALQKLGRMGAEERKEIEETQETAAALVRNWLAQGYSAKDVAQWITSWLKGKLPQEFIDLFLQSQGLAFQRGGVVPGTPGQAVPILAHAGEAVLKPDQFRFLNQNLADASALAAGLRENMQGINQSSVDKQRSDEERKLRNAQEAILREQEVILRWQEAILRQSSRQAATPPEQVATIVSKRVTTAESRALEEQARKIQEQMAEDEARRDRERDARDREQGDRNRSQVVVQPAAPGPVSVSIVVNARSDYELGKAEKMINRALGKKVDLAVRTRRMSGR